MIKVLSFTLNNKINEEKDMINRRYKNNSHYIKQSIQPPTINNDAYILRTYSPIAPFYFFGGKYKFNPKDNQAADILRKMFNTLINNLKTQNKYLNTEDINTVNIALDKIKELETKIAELITNGYNFVQNNTDLTQQKINLDRINTEIIKTNEKVISLRQKLDVVITKLYNEQIEKVKKTEEFIKKDFDF